MWTLAWIVYGIAAKSYEQQRLDLLKPIPVPVVPKLREKSYAGNDVYYRKEDLKKLAQHGIDLSGVKVFEEKKDQNRALVDHEQWSTTMDVDGHNKIVMPWAFHANFPEKEKVRDIIKKMNQDLGCVANIEVNDLSRTSHPFGVLLTWGNITGGGCWTTTGIAPGFVGDLSESMSFFGAPNTWQLISLDESCDGTSEATVMHELIHAWGFQHEHSRPDRTSFINVNLDNTDDDEQFIMLDDLNWRDSGFPYEIESVMHYCSTCGTNGKGPVMTYYDGNFFDSGQFMTTTDALQIQWKYCRNHEIPVKPYENCTSVDRFGFSRPVFRDRICDGRADCPNGEDENGELAKCLPAAEPTKNNCCSILLVNTEECHFKENWFGHDLYECSSNTSKVIFHFSGRWFLGMSGIPTGAFQYAAMIERNTTCPPLTKWTDGPLELKVFCKSAGPDFNSSSGCKSLSCGKNAVCRMIGGDPVCECEEGFEGNGFICNPVELVDECFEGIHDCHVNATCTDKDLGYECQCDEGFDEVDRANPGRDCKRSQECCKVFTLGVANHAFYNAICEYNRTQINGFMDYSCRANPIFPSHWWSFPMSVQYANILLHEYFLQSGPLTHEKNTVWSDIWDRQAASITNQKKCPVIGPANPNSLTKWKTMETVCLEFFDAPVPSPCSTGQHTCDVNSNCEELDNQGNYQCNCKIGYTKTPTGQFCIALVDECSSGLHQCNQNAFCFDKADGYGCICNEGFTGNGFKCNKRMQCSEHRCNLGYQCSEGVNGAFCEDIDECEKVDNECGDAFCQNTIGSFFCKEIILGPVEDEIEDEEHAASNLDGTAQNSDATTKPITAAESTEVSDGTSKPISTTIPISSETPSAQTTDTTTVITTIRTTTDTTVRTTTRTTMTTTKIATSTTTTKTTTGTRTTTSRSTTKTTTTTMPVTDTTVVSITSKSPSLTTVSPAKTGTPSKSPDSAATMTTGTESTTATVTTETPSQSSAVATTSSPNSLVTSAGVTEAPPFVSDVINSKCDWPENALTLEPWARFKQFNITKRNDVINVVRRYCPEFCVWETANCFHYSLIDHYTCVSIRGPINQDGRELFNFWTKEKHTSLKPRDAFFGGKRHQSPRRFGRRALCSPNVIIEDARKACGKYPVIPSSFRKWTKYSFDHKTTSCVKGATPIKDRIKLNLFCMKKPRWPRPIWVTLNSKGRYQRTSATLKRKFMCRLPK